jgi:hypothetical protein
MNKCFGGNREREFIVPGPPEVFSWCTFELRHERKYKKILPKKRDLRLLEEECSPWFWFW